MGTIVICRGQSNSSLIFPVEMSVTYRLISAVNEEFRVLNESLASFNFDGIVPLFSIPDTDDSFNYNKENLGFFGVGCGILSSLTEFVSHVSRYEIRTAAEACVLAESILKLHHDGKPQMVRRVVDGKRVRVAFSGAELVAAVDKAQISRDAVLNKYTSIFKVFSKARVHVNFDAFKEEMDKVHAHAVERRERDLSRPIRGGVHIRKP